ncbi:MAG: DUF6542 domain-containing protein [Marmoricola sp.]
MRAPTLWEEGRLPGDRVARLAVLACALVATVDAVLGLRMGWVFGVGFVLICLGAALVVHPRDFFWVGVLPPMLLLACSVVLSAVDRSEVGLPGNGYVQGVVSGLAHNADVLVVGYGLALLVLGIRHHVADRRSHPGVRSHPKRETSPAP